MRSRSDAVPPGAGAERALQISVCGIGGRLARAPVTLAEAIEATERQYDERSARRLRRFAAAPDGAVVWTRDLDGHFSRGQLAGSWRYDNSAEAQRADLVHVRPTRWTGVPLDSVPGAVLASFERGGRNFQRVRRLDQP